MGAFGGDDIRKHTHTNDCANENVFVEQVLFSEAEPATTRVFSHCVKLWWNESEPEVMCNIMQDETKNIQYITAVWEPSQWELS